MMSMKSSSLQIVLMLYLVSVACLASVDELEFSLITRGAAQSGPVMLVIGGIQGDEPGGFNAASLLATHYQVEQGQLRVVPNLNFPSIIKRSRGIHGDMNRKFLKLTRHDPEYDAIQKIKSIITSEDVDLILNLHDGSGFYSPRYINKLRNPSRWGQSIIIDRHEITGSRFNQLGGLAEQIVQQVNRDIGEQHRYYVKNTRTHLGNKEMEKTLTYFAIRHNKAAFGIEASKSFNTHERAYFHLKVVEAFMDKVGIRYSRDFVLGKEQVRQQIDNNIKLAFYDRKIILDMANARSRLGYVPLQKNTPLQFAASNPLVAVLDNQGSYRVRYGNRSVSRLVPQFFDYDDSLSQVDVSIDGQSHTVQLGSIVPVAREFLIEPIEGYRINVIGLSLKDKGDESGVLVTQEMIAKRFSVDKSAQRFRVEFYQQDRYCGMLLVDFNAAMISSRSAASFPGQPDT
jgi:hypothetical protein